MRPRRRSGGDRMTDFNFLRIKWPKLAAIAADAGRLVEVSPASAIATMQNFCEWAADIALDLYDINTQNGITQQEKLDTLKATGTVSHDILTRFQDIMMSGSRRLYRANEDVEEARRCIDDVYEIGRWLNKEADRIGWPPRSDYYRPVVSPIGMSGDGGSGSSGFTSGRVGQMVRNYKPFIAMGIALVVVGALATFAIKAVIDTNANAKRTANVIVPTPSVSATSMLATMPGDIASPTPPPEVITYLDTLTPTKTQNSFFLKKWKFQSGDESLTIGDTVYEHGIGMYIPNKSITQSQGTWSMEFDLNGIYSKLRFDLGVDAKLQYGEGYGKFRIRVYCNSDDNDPAYDSEFQEYKYTDLGREVDITGCDKLIIKLTEIKGSKGTINVVLGNICLIQYDDTGSTPAGTGSEPADSSTPDASASSSADASPSASATGGTEDEQEQPPG